MPTAADHPTATPTDTSPFAAMLGDLYHGRSWASGPAVSPDGERIAFVVATIDLDENTTASRVWLTSPGTDAAPVTAGPNDSQPAWSPDGRFLAFTSKRGEKDKEATLHVMPVTGPGEVRTLGTMAEGFGQPTWSPDGKHLAYISRTRDARYDAKDESWQPPRKIETFFTRLNGEGWTCDRPAHVYVIASDGTGKARNLTPGPYQHAGISWLPDSSALVTSAARHEGWDLDLAVDVHVVPLDGEIRTLTNRTGAYGMPSVSPDGTRIALLGADDPSVDPQNAAVGVISIDGGEISWISTALDRNWAPYPSARQPVWLDDERLLATVEDRGETHLYELAADGSRPLQALTKGPLTVQGFDAAGGTTATVQATVQRPAELFTLDGQVTSVTRSWSDWEKFTVPCTDGSDEIDAWIMRPADFDGAATYPVLLNVHGGPFTQYGETFFDEAQMQAAAGFVVLMCNPRGSSGRHSAWGQTIRGPKNTKLPGTGWGTVDVDDVLAVLDHALAAYPFCDGDRVGMLGGSYGGYMATTLAGRHSDRFRAICSERAVNNMLTEDYTADINAGFRTIHGPTIVEDPDEYMRISPIRHVRDIDCPVLIIHSEDDLRCPISQAEELFVALRLLGKDVTFYRFPAENHELSRSGSPVHRKMRAEIILEYFSDKLQPR
jgi:dipeptidyl aminopeptidase/acylaminoacyl peptidase